jgi:hypothetical protein
VNGWDTPTLDRPSSVPLKPELRSRIDSNAFSKYAIRSDPSIDQSPIVSDLETHTIDRLDDVQIFVAVDFAQHDVSD